MRRATSCAPGDSGPHLYSKMPSMSLPLSPASVRASDTAATVSSRGFGVPVRLNGE